MAISVALIAAQMWLGAITQPRPKKFTFEDLKEANKGDETRPIPYIRGKWKTKPQRIWLGDFSARAVERDSQWTDYLWAGALAGLLDFITVSYRYYVGQGFALTWGPINRVHQVYADDLPCAVSPVVDNAGGSILLDDPSLFGGDQPPGAGGVYGIADVIAGTYTQGRNSYVQSIEGNIPALHGIAALFIRGRSGATESGYFSAGQLNIHEWAVEVMAWPDVLNDGNARLPDDSFNRIHAMYEWATAADYGAEYPTAMIHRPSWLAASQTVFDEGLGFSGEINTGGNVGSVFDALKASVDAEVYEHPTDGLKIKLIRKDYSLPNILVLDESNTTTIEEYTPGDYADTFNKTTLTFEDASNNYQPRPAVYEDPANRTLQQRLSSKSIQFPGVSSAALAQLLVTREGRAAAQPFPPLVANAGEAGRDLWPGEVFQFQWSDPLVRKVFRVHARTPSVSFDGLHQFRITSTEDQYSIGMSVFGTPEGTDATNPADIWDTAPPSVTFDDTLLPPDGLEFTLQTGLGGALQSLIHGAVIFGAYEGGQYARVYVTEPGGVETLSPLRLDPDSDNKAQFVWPALTAGDYQFCVQTYSIVKDATNGTKVCASIGAASLSVSPSGSQSPSASVSASASPSVSPSSSTSPSLSPSGSPSESPSVSPSHSASPSGSASPSASTSPSHSTSPSSSASPSGGVPDDPSGPSPSDVTGLQLWLKANNHQFDGTADDTQITTWNDSSGNSRNGTGVAGGPGSIKPKFKLISGPNSYPAVRMVEAGSSNGGWFTLPNFVSGYTAGNFFAVVKLDNDPVSHDAAPPHGDWEASDDSYYPYSGDGKIYDQFGTTVRKDTISYAGSLTSWHVYEIRTASGAWSNHKNGTQLFTTGTNTVSFGTAPKIGRVTASSKTLQGFIAEIIFYNAVLSSSDRFNTIHTYLNNKYGFSLPTS